MKKRNLLGVLVIILAFGFVFTGCGSLSNLFSGGNKKTKTPTTFVKGPAGETTILLRQGLNFEHAFREVVFILNRHNFETEMMQPEVGYIRTRWNRWDSTSSIDAYRVRVFCNFNPNRTQLIVKIEAEYLENGYWVQGNDTKALETLRNDINMIVGN